MGTQVIGLFLPLLAVVFLILAVARLFAATVRFALCAALIAGVLWLTVGHGRDKLCRYEAQTDSPPTFLCR